MDPATAENPPTRIGATARRLPHLPALDGVRAIAVAGVLLYHGGVSWMPGGFLGVDVFFVLSGYLITSLLLAEREASGRIDLAAFWRRRARRLLPAAFVVIAVSLLAVGLLAPGDVAQTRGDAVSALLYVNNWHQILADQSYFAAFDRPSPLRHLWSLSIEEQFYVLWPLAIGLVLVRLGRARTAAVTLALAAASAGLMALLLDAGRDPSRVYYGTDTHACGLLIGAALAFAWPLGRFAAPRRPSAVVVLDVAALAALAAIAAGMVVWHDYDPFVYRGGIVAVSLVTAVLVAAVVHPAGRAGALLGTPLLAWIGARSYGIYLWHWPVMALSRPGTDLDWPTAVLVPAQIALTIALAAASYRWLEQPFRSGAAERELRRRLDRRAPHERLALVGASAIAAVAAIAWVATIDRGSDPVPALKTRASAAASSDPAAVAARSRRPLAVGASVMLAAEPVLGRHFRVDAAIGRQPEDVLARLERYRRLGRLPGKVVVQIGENGPLTDAELAELRRVLAGVERVALVNVRVPQSWAASVNTALQRAVAHWPQARLADWYDASERGGLLYDDGTHPRPSGQAVYARVVERALAD